MIPDTTYLMPELYVWGGGGSSGDSNYPEDAGLVMSWGPEQPEDGNYAAAWAFVYGQDPDLSRSLIKVQVLAPQLSPFGLPGQITQISLAIQDNQLTISTEDPENITTGKEVHDCVYEGEPMTISYNAAYLKEVLTHQNSDNVMIKLKTPVSAGIFIPEGGEEDIITLLMPIR